MRAYTGMNVQKVQKFHLKRMDVLSILEKVLNLGGLFGIIKRKCYLCGKITKTYATSNYNGCDRCQRRCGV